MKLKFFKLAKNVADRSSSYPRVGCVIVKKNRVISIGFNNRSKTHPDAANISQTLHAELHAILGVDAEELRGATAYVYREHPGNVPAMAKPCRYCHTALVAVGIRFVYFSTYGSFDGYEIERIGRTNKKKSNRHHRAQTSRSTSSRALSTNNRKRNT